MKAADVPESASNWDSHLPKDASVVNHRVISYLNLSPSDMLFGRARKSHANYLNVTYCFLIHARCNILRPMRVSIRRALTCRVSPRRWPYDSHTPRIMSVFVASSIMLLWHWMTLRPARRSTITQPLYVSLVEAAGIKLTAHARVSGRLP